MRERDKKRKKKQKRREKKERHDKQRRGKEETENRKVQNNKTKITEKRIEKKCEIMTKVNLQKAKTIDKIRQKRVKAKETENYNKENLELKIHIQK